VEGSGAAHLVVIVTGGCSFISYCHAGEYNLSVVAGSRGVGIIYAW